MAAAAGNSGTPLARKPGFKAGSHAHLIGAPPGWMDWQAPLPHDTLQLCLRHLREADLLHFQAYRSDAELGRYQGWLPMDNDAALAFLQAMAGSLFCPRGTWFQLGIADRASDRLIGDIGIHLQADGSAAQIGFTLARHAQGQGLALKAMVAAVELIFAHTPAARVVGITDARNGASRRVLERAGLRRFTTLDAVFRGAACVEHHHVRHCHALEDPAWIDHLYVHPAHAARGIGSTLLAHALATLPRPVQLWTFQANRHARAFYERHGFAAITFTDGADNEERCPDVLYRLA